MPRPDDRPDPLDEIARQIGELVESYPHAERYYDTRARRTRIHVTRHPPLLAQLHAATDPDRAHERDEHRGGGFESRAAANVDAVDRLAAIHAQAHKWIPHIPLEQALPKLVGYAAAHPDQLGDLARDVNRWWTWCRILGGWQDPPWRPQAPCPDCGQLPGPQQGLRVRLDIEWAICLSCETVWDRHTIGDLATRIGHRTRRVPA